MPRLYFRMSHTGVSQVAAAAEQGWSPSLPMLAMSLARGGKTRDTVSYLGVTALGLGCSLFIGKGKKCSDAQQGDLC